MIENNTDQNKQGELALFTIFKLALHNIQYILISGVAVALAALLIVSIFVSPVYVAKTSFYVYSTSAETVYNSDVQAAKNLASTYSKVLGSNLVMELVINNLDDLHGYDKENIKDNIKLTITSDSQLIDVTVKTDSPDLSYEIADTLSEIVPKEVVRIVKSGAIEVLDHPEFPDKKSSPKTIYDTLIGFFAGLIFSFGFFCLKAISDTTVYESDDVSRMLDVPVLGCIPEIKNVPNTKPWSLKEEGVISYDG